MTEQLTCAGKDAHQVDAGVELGLVNGRISLEADVL